MRTHKFTNLGKEITLHLHPFSEAVSDTIVRDNNFLEYASLNDLVPEWSRGHKTIIDVGANIGNHAVFFDEYFECESIMAFEPHPANYEILVQNGFGRNRVFYHNLGLSNYEGTAHIHIPGNNYGGGQFLTVNDVSSCFGGEPIRNNGDCRIVTLDSLKIKDVTFIKMDVEGHEMMVLEGAQETIKRCKPILFIEDFHDVYDNRIAELYGYKVAKVWPRHISINKIYVPA